MIEPTPKDIGRRVLYRSHSRASPRRGRIVSLSDRYVLVRYNDEIGRPHAIDRHNLEWAKELAN
jgi:hypothetical protein